ncbi:hypothetical protein H7S74_22760 [Priestia aryabhattai]|uniref:murein biosynthesis integral membrane protein MurJ n=1 Tax=Priestia aryabhattai TaxID=412384 RepID=UPI001EC889B5|nr:lipid II flippase MurJ [Priestia aryabhattai]MBY0091552.1 hypothetical protein [Priestia aryabhattai]MBY0104176.1 hypothetical protein [Priestia aryabhattai]
MFLKKNSLSINSLVLILISGISVVFGLLREMQIASIVGTTIYADIFYLAILLPELIGNIIGSATSNIYLRVYKLETVSRKELAGGIFYSLLIIGTVILLLLEILFPIISELIAPTYSGIEKKTLILFGRIVLPVILASVILGVVTATLNANNRFYLVGINGLVYSIVLIIMTNLLHPFINIYALSIGYLIAYFIRVLFIVPPMLKYVQGFNIKYSFKILKEVPRLIIYNSIISVQNVYEKSLASTISTGIVSILNYSNRIVTLPNLLITNSILTVIFPKLVSSSTNKKEFINLLRKSFFLLGILLFVSGIYIFNYSNNVITLLFSNKSLVNTEMLISVLKWYVPIMILNGLSQLLIKAAYAEGRTKFPVVINLISLIIYFILAISLKQSINSNWKMLLLCLFVYNLALFVMLAFKYREIFMVKLNRFTLNILVWTFSLFATIISFVIITNLYLESSNLIRLTLNTIIYLLLIIIFFYVKFKNKINLKLNRNRIKFDN